MRTGKNIQKITQEYNFITFIPNNLPFEINYDSELLKLLSDTSVSIGRLDGISVNIPDVDFFIFMYLSKEATHSSQIEGTQATLEEILQVESNVKDSINYKDVDEIKNYIDAMNYGLKRLKDFPLSLPFIKELHKHLLRGVRGEYKAPGNFRKIQNWIGGLTLDKAKFVPPPVLEMENALFELEIYIHSHSIIPAIVNAGLIHSQFETIHPFLDGNGRLGRLLITFYLMHTGILKKPLLYLSAYFNKNREEYYERLNNLREKDDIESWIKFFLNGVKLTSDEAIETIEKINSLRENDLMKIRNSIRNYDKAILLYNSLFSKPYVSVNRIEEITSLSNKNALILLKKFIDAGILIETTGMKRNRIFSYSKYVELFK